MAIASTLRTVGRHGRDAMRALALLPRGIALRLAPPPAGEVRVFYGHRRIPRPGEPALGGLVKFQAMETLYANSPQSFNVLYMVSSSLPPVAASLVRLARVAGARFVLNQNGVAYPGWWGAGYERVNAPLAHLLHRADHVFYQSDFCRRAADRFLGARTGPWEILYNAIDTERFAPAAPPLPSSPVVLLMAGTQDALYTVRTAFEAVAALARGGIDTRLLVAGRLRWTPDEAACARAARQDAARLGIGDRVEFVGLYTQATAPALYRRAHVLLHTTYNDPCPSPVIEALASGLPVVHSLSGGVPELVGPEAGVGIPVEQGWDRDVACDPQAVAAAVEALMARRDAVVAAARRRATERFDVRPWLARHREAFESLILGGAVSAVRPSGVEMTS